MKRTALALLTALLLAATPMLARAMGTTEIVVSGTGTVTLPPTLATISASVRTTSPNVSEAVAQNSAIYERVVAAVTKLGIARDDVTLSGYDVNYTPKPAKPDTEVGPFGYTVSRDFAIKVRTIAKAGSVVDACTGAGVTAIGGVSFGLADTRAARRAATVKAVAEARSEAQALADAAHVIIVGIKSISTDAGDRIVPMMRMAMQNAAPMPATQFDTGNVTVNVSVSMTFLASP